MEGSTEQKTKKQQNITSINWLIAISVVNWVEFLYRNLVCKQKKKKVTD